MQYHLTLHNFAHNPSRTPNIRLSQRQLNQRQITKSKEMRDTTMDMAYLAGAQALSLPQTVGKETSMLTRATRCPRLSLLTEPVNIVSEKVV